ncbi:MAG: helix-turn-helix domain-containing protein [Deltaproteobacteria bacterium]|nr:helix-turn-helix domain-containing protein [Deltaproteobacteria bacterium]
MAQIMTTKEMSAYLKLHEITICKYAAEGVIPAIRIGRVWRFDKDEIDRWIAEGPQLKAKKTKKTKTRSRKPRNK